MAGIRAQLRRLPPIASRDARIKDLRRSERELRAELERLTERSQRLEQERARLMRPPKYSPKHPSWHGRVMEQARVGRLLDEIDTRAEYPRRRLLEKLHNYELARSYGVSTPRVVGIWEQLEEVPWDTLPERFVLKSNRGFSGRGVLPLQRHDGAFRMIDSHRKMTVRAIESHYQQARAVAGPFFVEELLPGTAAVLPDDIKIYAFYGQVADVLLRRVGQHGDTGSISYRFVDADGQELGKVREGHRYDFTIEPPQDLALMVEMARELSLAVPVPFVRVDLYQVPGGVVLGELTPLPGSSETLTREHDRALGAMYDDAEARLLLDLTHGRPFTVTHGPHERDLSVPMAPTVALPSTGSLDATQA